MSNKESIIVNDISKKFRIYHETRTTIFDHVQGLLNGRRHHEDLQVLNNISFTVNKGDMLGIIGPNGCGKTTLLKLIANIIKPDKGVIKTYGSLVPLLELGVGLDSDLTAVDNIIQYGILLGFSKAEIASRTARILEFADLEKFADTKIRNFSTGMRARLAFSTAAEIEPDILLVDEVLSVGDMAFQKKSYDRFLTFKEKGKTIIFVSHNTDQVKRLCSKAIFLNEGKIASIGDTARVVDDYIESYSKKMKTANVISFIKDGTYSKEGKVQKNEIMKELRKLIDEKDYYQAKIMASELLKYEPNDAQLNYLFAYALHMLNQDLENALKHYEIALEQGFDEFWVRYNRGSLLARYGDTKAAVLDLRRALDLKPADAGVLTVLEQISNLEN